MSHSNGTQYIKHIEHQCTVDIGFQGFKQFNVMLNGVTECFSYFGYNFSLSDKFIEHNTNRPDVGILTALYMS